VRIKCTKFGFRWGSAPDPVWGAYSAPPNLLAAFKGPTSNGRRREKEGKKREGRGRKGERGERTEGRRGPRKQPLPWVSQNLGSALVNSIT